MNEDLMSFEEAVSQYLLEDPRYPAEAYFFIRDGFEYVIRGLEDIEKLPFTTYEDLNKAYPFGLAAVPKSELVRVHASSGTTGKPKIAVYTRRDIDTWSECAARCLTMAGVTKDDVIQVGYGYGLCLDGYALHGVSGGARCEASACERGAHEDAGCHSRSCGVGQQDAERCDKRGHP